MKTKRHLLLLACVLAALFARVVSGQSLSVNHNSPAATVTFTFRDAPVDYTVFAGDSGDDHYYIQVPAENVPSYKLSNAPGLKVMVDNEKTDEGHLVFWIPMQPGTIPRLECKNDNLILTFLPPLAPNALNPPRPTNANPPDGAVPSPPEAASGGLSSLGGTAKLAPVSQAMVDAQPVTLSDADLATPESPGFTVLGLTPQTVVRPTSPRAFVSSLLSGVDQNGNFQSGVALDTVPYLVFAGPALTIRKYNDSYPTRLLARTQFSFATTKGASDDDKATRLALGLRMTLWDAGDPHSDSVLIKCFVDNLKLPPPPPQIDPNNPTLSAVDQETRAKFAADNIKAADTCREDARKRNWNRSSWIIAAAPSWISTTGQTKDFKWNGAGFWTSLAYGFEGIPGLEKNSQFIFHARYRNLEVAPDPTTTGKFLVQDSFFLGARWRYGNENASANFEGVFQRTRPKGKIWDTSARYSLGIERRVAENMWFELSLGSQRGRQDGMNNAFVLSSFRWGFSQKRKITIPGLDEDAGTTH